VGLRSARAAGGARPVCAAVVCVCVCEGGKGRRRSRRVAAVRPGCAPDRGRGGDDGGRGAAMLLAPLTVRRGRFSGCRAGAVCGAACVRRCMRTRVAECCRRCVCARGRRGSGQGRRRSRRVAAVRPGCAPDRGRVGEEGGRGAAMLLAPLTVRRGRFSGCRAGAVCGAACVRRCMRTRGG
jgi:hypothetical protein